MKRLEQNLKNIFGFMLKNNKGVSLVEVVAASVIIGIVFVALITLFAMSTKTEAATKERTDAMMVAQDLMEQSVRVQKYVGLSHFADGLEYNMSDSITDIYTDKYDAVRVVEEVPDTSGRLLRVVVKVKEKGEADYQKAVILVTLLSDIT